ncbi:hypothetical protein OG746_26940 [Streptomyces sp. NBC_01016]|uniref:hypothetical protein n=1 Tax=Streptomyces sp. NBC_01016 TaxID=2903720 RepID=UPI002252E81F|nr:hypothetical protein [Streptomyces sp. NBC_01016]MCX4827132.1 hypothetical protein [Streptomyces sp. NBC_01016]MCX4832379.1 hypothetical protein [Streptomyces sp. NBC_01016]
MSTAAETENYPGELAMLRGLVSVIRTIAEHGDMDELRRVLVEHEIDEQAAYDAREKASATAPTATPHVFIEDDRLRALHDAMTAKRGEWRTGDVRRVLRDAGFKGLGRNTASQFLRALVDRGLASAHGPDDGRFYTLSTTGKDGRS